MKFDKYSVLFEKILDFPSNYVSHNSISLIKPFMDGYIYATNCDQDELYSGFNNWIAEKFGIKTAHNWELIINFISGSEIGAYSLTQKLWVEYKNNQKTITSNNKSIEIKAPKFMQNSELLEKILERPLLYIGHASVTRMKLFIDGYEFARPDYGGEMKDALYDGFQKWVANRFGFGHSHSWASIISFMGVSETRAFELTKELWEKYKAEIKKTELIN